MGMGKNFIKICMSDADSYWLSFIKQMVVSTCMSELSIEYDFYSDPNIIQYIGIYEKCKGAYAPILMSWVFFPFLKLHYIIYILLIP